MIFSGTSTRADLYIEDYDEEIITADTVKWRVVNGIGRVLKDWVEETKVSFVTIPASVNTITSSSGSKRVLVAVISYNGETITRTFEYELEPVLGGLPT